MSKNIFKNKIDFIDIFMAILVLSVSIAIFIVDFLLIKQYILPLF